MEQKRKHQDVSNCVMELLCLESCVVHLQALKLSSYTLGYRPESHTKQTLLERNQEEPVTANATGGAYYKTLQL